jgi:peptidoglycan/LPS O-acetylase OafA/YrhL
MLANQSFKRSHFLALPLTRLGRASAWLFVFGLAVWVVSIFLPRGTDLSIGPVDPVALGMVVGFFGAFFTGAVALIGYHERSWAVWVATLLPVLAIALDVVVGLLLGG